MNARFLIAFLCLASVSTGCVIVDHDDDLPGDVTFIWTFASAGAGRCSDVPNVKNVRVIIPGESLHNGGVYACNTAGTDGIVLHDFAPGRYSYTLQALGYSDEILYQASGSFLVDGDTRLNVNLTPNGSPSSFAYVSWYFEGSNSCYQAGVTHVDVSIDGGEWERIPCEEGIGSNQVRSPYLAPGHHTIDFIGMRVTNSGATPYFYRSGTLDSVAGSPISVSYSLWAVGGLSLRWELIDGSVAQTCAQSGVTQVTIHLFDETRQEYVYGNEGDVHRCDGAPVIFRYLRPGNYTIIMDGTGPGNVYYTNRYNSPPSRTVTAFSQPTEFDPSYTLYLPRLQ